MKKLLLVFLLLNYLFSNGNSAKLLCEELLSKHFFNEPEIMKQIDANIDILKTQIG